MNKDKVNKDKVNKDKVNKDKEIYAFPPDEEARAARGFEASMTRYALNHDVRAAIELVLDELELRCAPADDSSGPAHSQRNSGYAMQRALTTARRMLLPSIQEDTRHITGITDVRSTVFISTPQAPLDTLPSASLTNGRTSDV